jgi:hypothetical protein
VKRNKITEEYIKRFLYKVVVTTRLEGGRRTDLHHTSAKL